MRFYARGGDARDVAVPPTPFSYSSCVDAPADVQGDLFYTEYISNHVPLAAALTHDIFFRIY